MSHHKTVGEREYYAQQTRVWRIAAPFYDVIVAPLGKMRDRVVSFSGAQPGDRVLDVATGTGKQAAAFARRGCDVYGIDLTDAMIRVAAKKNRYPNLALLLGDAASLPFHEATFDVTCISFALHEMPLTVIDRVLGEMARVTRPQGIIVIADYGLPRQRIVRLLVYGFIRLFEGKTYADFVGTDLPAALGKWGARVTGSGSAAAGIARVVTAAKG